MSTTLADITTLIDDRRRDATTNSMTNDQRLRAINSTLDIWNSLHDWDWTIQNINFNYNQGIDTYPLSTLITDFKTDITIKPYLGLKAQEFWKVSENKFDSALTKPNRYAILNNGAKQYLRIKAPMGMQGTLNTATSVDGEGTWVGAGGISDVYTDQFESYNGTSSIGFTFTGTSGTLTNSTFNAVQAQMYKNRGNVYFYVDITETTNLTSFSLKWGSSASDYYTVTATTDYVGEAFKLGWNCIKLAWDNPTTVGAPDDTAINYLQLTVAYSVDPAGVLLRFQNVFVSENVPLTMRYYSTNMVYDVSASVPLQKFNDVTATTDRPLWSGQWDAVTETFINCALETVFWMTGEYTDISVARQKIADLLEPLKARYPSQRRKVSLFVTTDTNLMVSGRRDNYLPQFYAG